MSAPQETETPHPEFSPLSIARTIWKKKISILAVWLTLTAVIFVVVMRLPTIYSSEALILVDSQKIPDKFVSSTVSSDLQDRIASISQQILSATRLRKIIEDFNLYGEERKRSYEEDILEKMREDIGVKLEKGYDARRPGAFRVSYRGTDPEVVAKVARQLASLFIDENLKTREVQAEGTSEFIDTQLQEAKKRLDKLEIAVSDFKVKHNGELPQQETSLSATLGRLQVELETNRDAINRTQQNKVMLQNELSSMEALQSAVSSARSTTADTSLENPNVPVPSQALPDDTGVAANERSEVLQAQRDALLETYKPAYPAVRRLDARIAKLKEKEAREEKSSAIRTQISLTDQELDRRKADHERIVSQMSTYEARLSTLPIREQEMAQISRDYEISKDNYRSLLDKKYAAQMSTDMERRQKSERFTLLDPPQIPEKPLSRHRPLLDMAGSLLGLFLGLAVALLRERRGDALLGEWELPAHVLILGRLPNIEVPRGKPAAVAGSPCVSRRLSPTMGLAVVSIVICALGPAASCLW